MILAMGTRDVLLMHRMHSWLPHALRQELLVLKADVWLLWAIDNATSLIVQTPKDLRVRGRRQQDTCQIGREPACHL